MAEYHI